MDLQDLFLRKLDVQQKLNKKFFLSKLRARIQGYVILITVILVLLYKFKFIFREKLLNFRIEKLLNFMVEKLLDFRVEELYENKKVIITVIVAIIMYIILKMITHSQENSFKNILTNANIYNKYHEYKKLEEMDFQDKKKIIAMEWFLFENDISKYVRNISLIKLIYKYLSYNKKLSFTKKIPFSDIFENKNLQSVTEIEVNQTIEAFENFSIDNKILKSNDEIIEMVLGLFGSMDNFLFIRNIIINLLPINTIRVLWNRVNNSKISYLEVLDSSIMFISKDFLSKKTEIEPIKVGESYFIEQKRLESFRGRDYIVYDIIFLEEGKISFQIEKGFENIEDAQKLSYYLNKKLFS